METRNVKLSLEKAKEFYAKGGEFRDLALSAFTKEELTGKRLPKTWGEFCCLYPITKEEYYIGSSSSIQLLNNANYAGNIARNSLNYNLLPSKEAAEAHSALMKLHQLRDCYRRGWKPNYTDREVKYSIIWAYNDIHVHTTVEESNFLTFQSLTLAEEFLNNFKDLIKRAGDLI